MLCCFTMQLESSRLQASCTVCKQISISVTLMTCYIVVNFSFHDMKSSSGLTNSDLATCASGAIQLCNQTYLLCLFMARIKLLTSFVARFFLPQFLRKLHITKILKTCSMRVGHPSSHGACARSMNCVETEKQIICILQTFVKAHYSSCCFC